MGGVYPPPHTHTPPRPPIVDMDAHPLHLLLPSFPYVQVPPELRVPSESQSDFINDTAPNMARRDVELDW